MHPSARRRLRWAFRGALILAATAVVLGLIFTVVIALAERQLPVDGAGWLGLIARTTLIWGGVGLFFGSILGLYASLIWRDPNV